MRTSAPPSLKEEIQVLKKKRGAVILAHNYEIGEVQEVADFVGDSLGLSREAARQPAKVIVFCGVSKISWWMGKFFSQTTLSSHVKRPQAGASKNFCA